MPSHSIENAWKQSGCAKSKEVRVLQLCHDKIRDRICGETTAEQRIAQAFWAYTLTIPVVVCNLALSLTVKISITFMCASRSLMQAFKFSGAHQVEKALSKLRAGKAS
jgi:hypothetical protein